MAACSPGRSSGSKGMWMLTFPFASTATTVWIVFTDEEHWLRFFGKSSAGTSGAFCPFHHFKCIFIFFKTRSWFQASFRQIAKLDGIFPCICAGLILICFFDQSQRRDNPMRICMFRVENKITIFSWMTNSHCGEKATVFGIQFLERALIWTSK